ncbi:MAG: beta-propeller fold lactonase family protein [Ignavibacteria bacterium]|nr:beta-propeller fold lactonase family protein [Ignavibacteria bacterium]
MKNKNLLLALVILSFAFIFSSCSDDQQAVNPTGPSWNTRDVPDITENGENPDETILSSETDNPSSSGFIYIQSNDAGLNSVLIYRQQSNGSLTLQATVSSGGNGTGGGLGNQGAITINENEKWLFAVNAGSNSVSSFRISNNGNLTLAHTMSTGGIRPVSVTSYRRLLYVVNAGSDNISGFRIGGGGTLTAIAGSMQSLSSTGTGPAQISFSPNGNFLYVTEKATDKITTFPVGNNGAAGSGTSVSSTGQTPFGFDIARDKYLIVSNAAGGAANQSSATSYSGLNAGNLSPVNGAVGNNQAAACWVAVTKYGRFAFVRNTGSDNISSYYVAPFGGLFLLHAAIPSEDAPTEIIVADNNIYVYALNSASHTISCYRRTILGNLNSIGTTTGLPSFATGIAAR